MKENKVQTESAGQTENTEQEESAEQTGNTEQIKNTEQTEAKVSSKKNLVFSVCIMLGYLILVFILDAILVSIFNSKNVSSFYISWWKIVRFILLLWSVAVFIFARSFNNRKSKDSKSEVTRDD